MSSAVCLNLNQSTILSSGNGLKRETGRKLDTQMHQVFYRIKIENVFFHDSGLPIGANCSGEEMCLDDRSVCNPVLGACECVDGTYDSNGDMPGGVCLDCKCTSFLLIE